MFSNFYILNMCLALALSAGALSADDYTGILGKVLRDRATSGLDQELQAATKAVHLEKRRAQFSTVTQVQLSYTGNDNSEGGLNFGASIHCSGVVPILLLEDFEHLVESIACEPDHITLTISAELDRESTTQALRSLEAGGLVITSHYGCNAIGERTLFRVEKVQVNRSRSVYVLDVVQAAWQNACKSLDVKIHRTLERHALRPHSRLQDRENSRPTTSTRTADRTKEIVPQPTETRTTDVSTLDLNKGYINERLIGSENSSIQLTCKNCSTFGTLDFSFAQFRFQPNVTRIVQSPVEIGDYIQGGEMNVVANGMGARVELLTNITGNATLDAPLFTIPLVYGIAIRGFGAVGLLYAPAVHVAYNLNGSIAFTTGFEIKVPDKSRLFIDMTDPRNSTVGKFDQTTITGIPFQASIEVDNAVIDVSLRHQVQVGLFFDVLGTGVGVGVYLDLPKYRAEFEKVQGVDETCTALESSRSQDKDVVQRVLTDAFRIKPSVNWQVGMAGEYKVLFLGGKFDVPFDNGTISNLTNSCLQFNRTSGTYVDAKQLVADAKKNAAVGPATTLVTSMLALVSVTTSFLLSM